MTEEPQLRVISPGQQAACHWSEKIDAEAIQSAAEHQPPVNRAEPTPA